MNPNTPTENPQGSGAVAVEVRPGDWLTYAQSVEHTKLSKQTIWRAVGRGELNPARVGRSVRFRREDLDAWLMSQTEQV